MLFDALHVRQQCKYLEVLTVGHTTWIELQRSIYFVFVTVKTEVFSCMLYLN